MRGGKEKHVLGFGGEIKINCFQDLFVDVRVILKWILNKDWNRWRAVVNTVMNIRVL
jgi:hypothetical protein